MTVAISLDSAQLAADRATMRASEVQTRSRRASLDGMTDKYNDRTTPHGIAFDAVVTAKCFVHTARPHNRVERTRELVLATDALLRLLPDAAATAGKR